MKPTIGRIVHYRFAPGLPVSGVWPAIVTAVSPDGIVFLEVFGQEDPSARFRFGPEVTPDGDVGGWFWPPRVGS